MRTSQAPLALLTLPYLAHAVTLSDFQSGNIRNTDTLSSACQAVYTEDISGCSPTDFQNPPCSKSCVSALVGLVQTVYDACHNDGLKGPSILFQYLHDNGPQSLCTNDADVSSLASSAFAALQTSAATSSSAAGYGQSTSTSPQSTAASTSSTEATSSSVAAASSSISSPSSSASSMTDVSATSSSASTSSTSSSTATSLVVDTSSSPSVQSTASSTSSSSGSSQTNINDHSGGGSPFDTTGNSGSSAASTVSSSALALVLAAAGAMLALR